MTTFKPQTNVVTRNLDIFNEVTTVILVDSLLVMTNANQSPFDFESDVVFATLLFGNVAFHTYFLLKSTYLET